jgi:putative ABC transport system substrate-binding protein
VESPTLRRMSRRQVVVALAASVALLATRGVLAQQQGRVWRIGFLSPNSRPASLASHRFGAFVQGLRDHGYVEGKNLTIEWRYAEDAYDRMPAMTAELARLKVDVIVAAGTGATRAAQKASSAIPIVMLGVADPVRSGFIDSLARPGRNTTGTTLISPELGPKWLEIARNVVPKLKRVGVLVNVASSAYSQTLESVRNAAKAAGISVFAAEVRAVQDIESAFDALKREGVGALVVQNESVFVEHGRRIGALAAKTRLPSITGRREFAEAGCLISYGPNVRLLYRAVAGQVDKILKGASAGDLPVEQPTDYELVVNQKTAKAIGLTIPRDLLLRADKVIEV